MDSLKEFTVTGNPAVFNTNIVKPLKSLIMPFAPIQASGTPSPDNPLPITGWTGCNVTRTGKNLFDGEWELGAINVNTGAYVDSTTSIRFKNLCPLHPGTTFNLSHESTSTYILIVAYKHDKSYSRYIGAESRGSFNITLNADEYYISVYWYNSTTPLANCQIEVGTSASPYETYDGDTYPISWQTEAGTVYGGTVNPVTGKLIVTDAEIASYNGETLPSTWISDRDVYAEGTTPTIGAQVVYKLASPFEYDITPITINPLLGDNTIFSDTNGINTITYLKR